ncbi:hypothetical protein PPACK8108_LOCUS17101 [Phakopsora pachyrhizi]|uniref:Uncharacterized protein n=1 Tax=Phakopsora pachyrhizi TaxID=170000 RepID=A0AAV0BCC0_PHAPC|nr:hypothetical protein PPACK8108_LOCUS17101 [Phakopsora pachyrhizi]
MSRAKALSEKARKHGVRLSQIGKRIQWVLSYYCQGRGNTVRLDGDEARRQRGIRRGERDICICELRLTLSLVNGDIQSYVSKQKRFELRSTENFRGEGKGRGHERAESTDGV